jgi:hypothetical protein
MVRGTTRRPDRIRELEAAGIEPVLGDPDKVATIAPAFEHVAVVCILLGSATDPTGDVRALHGPRLDMLLLRMLDTTIRGVVYETAGSVAPDVLTSGGERLREACEGSRIPNVLLTAAPGDHAQWLSQAVAAAERVLGGG